MFPAKKKRLESRGRGVFFPAKYCSAVSLFFIMIPAIITKDGVFNGSLQTFFLTFLKANGLFSWVYIRFLGSFLHWTRISFPKRGKKKTIIWSKGKNFFLQPYLFRFDLLKNLMRQVISAYIFIIRYIRDEEAI